MRNGNVKSKKISGTRRSFSVCETFLHPCGDIYYFVCTVFRIQKCLSQQLVLLLQDRNDIDNGCLHKFGGGRLRHVTCSLINLLVGEICAAVDERAEETGLTGVEPSCCRRFDASYFEAVEGGR